MAKQVKLLKHASIDEQLDAIARKMERNIKNFTDNKIDA